MNLNKWYIRFVGGVLLYVISLMIFFLNCSNLPYDAQESILTIAFIVGASVTVFATLYKTEALVKSIINLIIIIAIWFVVLALNGYLGTASWLENLLKLNTSYENNAAGVIIVMFMCFNCCSSLIAIIIKKLVKWLIKTRNGSLS